MSREQKKRNYYRKCGWCGERHEQGDMRRTNKSPNGWLCFKCYYANEILEANRPFCRDCACKKVCEYFEKENERDENRKCVLKFWQNYFVPKPSRGAREILNELSSYCHTKWREAKDKSNIAMLRGYNDEVRIWLNRQRAYEDISRKITELKKKYTEDKNG